MIKNKKHLTIESAFNLFNTGESEHALTICQTLLKKNKKDINALNLTAIIKDKLNDKQQAIIYFKRALKLSPNNIQTLINIGLTSFEINQFSEAKKYFNNALLLDPKNVDSLFNLANIAYSEKETEKAIDLYSKTISIAPNHINALNNLANAYHQIQNYDAATKHYTAALHLSPLFIESLIGITCVYYNDNKLELAYTAGLKALSETPGNLQILLLLAKICQKLSKTSEAIDYYTNVTSVEPDEITSYLKLGRIYLELESFEPAKVVLEKALSIDDNNADAHNLYGHLSKQLSNDSEKSFYHFNKSFDINPNQAELACNIGKEYIKKGDFETATFYINKSAELEPNNANTLCAQGVIQQALGNYSAAQSYYEKALKIHPDCTNFHSNLGYLHIRLSNLELANFHLQKAIDIEPTHQNANNNLSTLSLMLKDFENGWKQFRYRNAVQNEKHEFPPENLDKSITKNKLLVFGEQGIGDELFYLRFMDKLNSLGFSISYLTCEKLFPILEPLNIVDSLLTTMPDRNLFAHCISIGDLPYLLNHNVSNTPPPLPLKLNSEAVELIRNILNEFGPPPYIGITWRAGGNEFKKHTGSYFKEINLDSLCHILENEKGTIIAIQKNSNFDELNTLSEMLHRPILDASIYHDDLEKMLALLSIIDTYITVSNTNLHLREGLKKNSRVLVCSPPEWRWLESGKRSLWFPHSIIYRQSLDESWEVAISELLVDSASGK